MIRTILLTSMNLCAAGCAFVTTIHPLASPKVTKADERILGDWFVYDETFNKKQDGARWRITEGERQHYKLAILEDGTTTEHNLALVQLGDTFFFDIIRRKSADISDVRDSISVHHIVKVSIASGHLQLSHPVPAAKHREVFQEYKMPMTEVDGKILLTSSTEELQAFYKAHANELFKDEMTTLKK